MKEPMQINQLSSHEHRQPRFRRIYSLADQEEPTSAPRPGYVLRRIANSWITADGQETRVPTEGAMPSLVESFVSAFESDDAEARLRALSALEEVMLRAGLSCEWCACGAELIRFHPALEWLCRGCLQFFEVLGDDLGEGGVS